MAEHFLSLNNVSKRYVGVQALDAVDLTIDEGEIHCVVGENGSGKSTLIKIISGVVEPDPGSYIEVDGEAFHDYQAIDAMRKGIEVIYQDLSLFPNLSVAENIALNEMLAAGAPLVSWRQMEQIASAAMQRVGVNLPLHEEVGDISLADQQLVAICRALTRDVRLVIMDEPTTALTRKEVRSLFRVVKDLQAKGIATMFVSHKLDEVFEIAERVTVLRDGKKVGTFASQELDDEKLTMLMTGKHVGYESFHFDGAPQPPILEVCHLSRQGAFQEISFSIQPGEIVGVTGLLGSGRTDLALSLFGMNPASSGEIRIEGQPVNIRSVQDAVAHGIGYVPENRLVQGLIMQQAVDKNVVVTILRRLLNRLGLINPERVEQSAAHWIDELAIRVPAVDAPVEMLSGGNQQRVVLAKWIATQPKILILDGPTVGVDVAAKGAIHEIVRSLAARGVGVLLISDEIREVYHNCNRVFIMHGGRFVNEFDTSRAAEDDIQAAVQQSSQEVALA